MKRNGNGTGKDGNVRRKPRETTGPLRSQKRIDGDGDRSRIDSFKRERSAAAVAPVADLVVAPVAAPVVAPVVAPVADPAMDHGRIAERAFAIWQQRGCPSGRDVATWCEAEAELEPGPQR